MTKGGIFVFTMLLVTMIFFVLKACGIFGAPWFWVFCPIWMPIGEIFLASVVQAMIKSFDGRGKKDQE